MDETVTAYGAAEFAPGAERTIAAPAEAVVVQTFVTPGAPVRAGDPIAAIAPSPAAKLDLHKAEQDAHVADQALARAERLKATGLDSDADVELARGAAKTADALLASLRGRAGAMTLRSPITGVIETLTAAPGDLIASGGSLGKGGRLHRRTGAAGDRTRYRRQAAPRRRSDAVRHGGG